MVETKKEIRLALIGAGAIGRAHLNGARLVDGLKIAAIAGERVNGSAHALAAEYSVPWFADYRGMLDREHFDGVVIASPNNLHLPMGVECLSRRLPVLLEKPVADSVGEGQQLFETATKTGTPLLIGFHRRHNPIVREARKIAQAGALGRIVAVNVQATVYKAASYFDAAWRREPGGGPILINLSHEVDLLRFIVGEIASVQAIASNAVRGFAVEDTAAVLLRFANGALGTIMLSDTAVGPWIWDQVTHENPAFPCTHAETHFLCGTEGSISLPNLRLWRYQAQRDNRLPLSIEEKGVEDVDPYKEQMRHFAAVIRKEEQPITNGMDATRSLEVILAIKEAAVSGRPVDL